MLLLKKLILYMFVFMCSLTPEAECSFFDLNYNSISEIRTDLLRNYNEKARPVSQHTYNTTVTFGISLNNIDLDDHNQRLIAVTFLLISWNDEFLKWDPKFYGNVTSIHFDKEEVWVPDIALFNSAKSVDAVPSSTLPVVCYNDGTLLWVPPFTAEVPCQIDLTNWPSDVHSCTLRFGSWAHHGSQIDLQLVEKKPISMEFYEVNKRWKVINVSATKESTIYSSEASEVYFHVDFRITLKREAASHAAYVTQTTFGVMLLVLGSYLLPLCYHVSRILIHLFSMTILVICNLVLFITLPSPGGSIPHVVRYFFGSIILTSLSLLCNIVLATSLSSNFKLHGDLNKTLTSLLKGNNTSTTYCNGNEVGYSNLAEEVIEMPNSSSENVNSERQNKAKTANSIRAHRVLNLVMFSMFSLAYIIDYAVMRNIIGY